MSTRDELIADLSREEHAPMSDHDPRDGSCRSCPWPIYMLGPSDMADALIAEGWRRKPSEQELFSRDPDSALAAFVDSFNGDEAGDIEWVSALDGNTGYAMRGGNDVESVFRKAADAILALMDRGQ